MRRDMTNGIFKVPRSRVVRPKKKTVKELKDDAEVHLIKYLPYYIEVQREGYYMFNRLNGFIGMIGPNRGYCEMPVHYESGGVKIYLFDDTNSPLYCKKVNPDRIAGVVRRFARSTESKACLNPSEETSLVMKNGAQNVGCRFRNCGRCNHSHSDCKCAWTCACQPCIDCRR
jgi:hypothetical protein